MPKIRTSKNAYQLKTFVNKINDFNLSVQNAFSDFELLNGRQLSYVYMNNAIRTYIEYLKIHVGKYEKCDFGTERKKLQKTF